MWGLVGGVMSQDLDEIKHVWLTMPQWSVSYQTQMKETIFQKRWWRGRKENTKLHIQPVLRRQTIILMDSDSNSLLVCATAHFLYLQEQGTERAGIFGFIWEMHCTRTFEGFQDDGDQRPGVRYVVEMDFSCSPLISRHLFPACGLLIWVSGSTPYGHLCPWREANRAAELVYGSRVTESLFLMFVNETNVKFINLSVIW